MSRLSSATLHEAHAKRGALPAEIQALDGRMRIRGTAFPVATAVGDNLWLHRAVRADARGIRRPSDLRKRVLDSLSRVYK